MAEKLQSIPASTAISPKAGRKTQTEIGESGVKMGKRYAEISRMPLEKQDTSDAWNERQNRLAAGRMSADLLTKGTMLKNKAKQ